jgi:4-amino-4-deoxy-L-arabinose transferase-like glycosyltransferase
MDRPDDVVPGERPGRWLLAALAVGALLLFVRLGAKDVWEASEGRPLESAREMRATGEHLVQRTNGATDLTKPPLYAWATMAMFAVFGDREWAARIPAALSALGVLGAVFVLARRVAGPRAGFLAATLCATTAKFLWQGRLAELEMPLACGSMWAFAFADAALAAPTARARIANGVGLGAALGFASAVKGPIALVMVLPGLLAYAIATRRARSLASTWLAAGLVVAVVGLLAWPLAVLARSREWFDVLVSYGRGENVVGHQRGPFYYLLQYPLYALPWTPLVALGLTMRWARPLEGLSAARARLPVCGFAAAFVVQSFLSAKQTHYLVPVVFPMGALLAGLALDHRMRTSPRRAFRPAAVRAALATVVVVEAAVVAFVVPAFDRVQSSRAFMEAVDRTVPLGAPLAWTTFGSHSDHLWHFRAERVAARGIPEIRTGDDAETARRVLAFLDAGGVRWAVATGPQADLLAGKVDVVLRDDAFQKKRRSVALLRTKAP